MPIDLPPNSGIQRAAEDAKRAQEIINHAKEMADRREEEAKRQAALTAEARLRASQTSQKK